MGGKEQPQTRLVNVGWVGQGSVCGGGMFVWAVGLAFTPTPTPTFTSTGWDRCLLLIGVVVYDGGGCGGDEGVLLVTV